MADELIKPNSDAALERSERRDVEPATVRKRSGFRDFLNAIRPKNPDSFLNHIFYDILRTAGLNVAEDILKDGIDAWLHPSDPRYRDSRYYRRDDRRRGGNGVSYISYDNMYETPDNSRPYNDRYRDRSPNPREIVYRNRDTADMVLEEMRDYIYESGFVSIGEFYEILKRVTN